jgi:septal ring factor EnvC (AmiA/AmiB activator)
MPRFLLIALLFLALSQTAVASERDTIAAKLKNEQAFKKSKEAELKNIEKELGETSNKLVSTASSLQKSEKSLETLEDRIAELEKQQKEIQKRLEGDQGSLSTLLLALERLRRMPPEAMIVQPETPLKTAQSALLLRDILPALQQKTDALKADLEKLSAISKDLQDQKEKATKENIALASQQDKLSALVKERKDLFTSTHKDIEEQARKIEHISAQSKTLSDLVQRLRSDKEEKKAPEEKPSQFSFQALKSGSARLPVSGTVVTSFSEPDNFGAPSQGIDIEAREGAVVVAPMGGVVRFAGHFKNYGNMVILEHEKGWHSLIAGLKKIDTVVGQSVSVGEPLGILNKSSDGRRSRLYYELRQNGKAVNPAKKFGELS